MSPERQRLAGRFGSSLTVDVEEWYHTCLVPSYVRPELRPPGLPQELDRLLPELCELLADASRTATFFILGEVADRLPERVREIAAAGHEVASHGRHHLRVSEVPAARFAADLRRSKAQLEDLVGQPVRGFRAPEWSFRRPSHPHLALVAEAGFLYDSSLAPFLGAGRLTNSRWPERLSWGGGAAAGGRELLEFPPLTFGGPLRLPAGSWTGRLVRPQRVARAAAAQRRRGGLPVAVVHPWEVSGRPTPGPLAGFARFIHETGRLGYRERFRRLLAALPWESLWSGFVGQAAAVAAASPRQSEEMAEALASGSGAWPAAR
jgi:peptidoglycan-N-acetylglucosamine deacetylase